MKLDFKWEKFSGAIPELPRLFSLHYDEVIRGKLDIHLDFKWNRHLDLEQNGILKFMAARSQGLLVGYVFWIVCESLNFDIKEAITSLYYLDPLYRSADEHGVPYGKLLLRKSEPGLKKMGADFVMITTPFGPATPVFDRLMKSEGYNSFENVYSKSLQGGT